MIDVLFAGEMEMKGRGYKLRWFGKRDGVGGVWSYVKGW